MILLIEKNLRGGIASVMGDRFVKSNVKKKILYIDATNLFGHSMSQPLPFDETKVGRNVCLQYLINTADDTSNAYFLDVDSRYSFKIGQKAKQFPLAPENKTIS